MALSAAQLNAHIRSIVADELDAERRTNPAVVRFFIAAALRHYRLGGVDNQEAAQTVARFVWQQVIGRSPTQQDLHEFLNHVVTEADETAGGLLG